MGEFVEKIVLQRASGKKIFGTANRVLQIIRESRDMGIIDARIGGKLRAGQFATLPGTVKWMLQDRSLANQFIQGTQGFFGSHNVQCFGGSLPERKSKKYRADLRARQPSSTGNASP